MGKRNALLPCPHCASRVRGTGRRNITNTVADCYATCTNAQCPESGATLVFQIHYARTVKPSTEKAALALSILSSLSPEDRLAVMEKAAQI